MGSGGGRFSTAGNESGPRITGMDLFTSRISVLK